MGWTRCAPFIAAAKTKGEGAAMAARSFGGGIHGSSWWPRGPSARAASFEVRSSVTEIRRIQASPNSKIAEFTVHCFKILEKDKNQQKNM
jgi:hypothetical protein